MIRYRKSRLARAIILATGVACVVSDAVCDTVSVNRCNDQDGIQYIGYSLRKAINVAQEGDTVDMSGLVCSTISLERGALEIFQNNLTIRGPTSHTLTIEAGYSARVFHHTGNGVAEIDYLATTGGSTRNVGGPLTDSIGGCIMSESSLSLRYLTVSDCLAFFAGGGVGVKGNLALIHSTITGNRTLSPSDEYWTGAGVYAKGGIIAAYSVIAGNSATGENAFDQGALYSRQGVSLSHSLVSANNGRGVFAWGDVVLSSSTVEDNEGSGIGSLGTVTVNDSTIASNGSNGIRTEQGPLPGSTPGFRISNSTLSGNGSAGIAASNLQVAEIVNSTIAFNVGRGVFAYACNSEITIVSSIIAANAPGFGDFYLEQCSVGGNNNFFGSLFGSIPASPHLGPLAYHGGPVKTHALLANSPAIDTGANPLDLSNDGRGPGFSRTVGTAADIGAYERQVNDDQLFYGGFD